MGKYRLYFFPVLKPSTYTVTRNNRIMNKITVAVYDENMNFIENLNVNVADDMTIDDLEYTVAKNTGLHDGSIIVEAEGRPALVAKYYFDLPYIIKSQPYIKTMFIENYGFDLFTPGTWDRLDRLTRSHL